MSPSAAVTSVGSKVRVPLTPTEITITDMAKMRFEIRVESSQ